MNKTSKQIILVMAVLWCMLPVSNTIGASDKGDGILRYNIPVVTGAERFVDILEYPAYLAISLQNSGIVFSLAYEVKIKDHQTFEIKGTEFKFIKKDGKIFFYQIKLLGVMGNVVPIVDMIVDVSTIHNGVITLSLSSPVVKILPMSIIDRIKGTVFKMSNEYNQKTILEYYNKLSSASYRRNKMQGILEGIMIDAYNMHINDDGKIYKADTKALDYFVVFIYIAVILLMVMMIYIRAKK
jgi:hypothetical protein